MASASIPAQPGETIAGKYQIERVIGVGGAGMVVAARHVVLNELVAIKFLLPGAAHNRHEVLRFEREAKSAVKLKNEHVCRVYDVGELEDGSPFIVLEYLEGQDLAQVLRDSGPLSIRDTATYLLQVAEAVSEAHDLGIVHRDLKPANFFLTRLREGLPLVKVLDFGIAMHRFEFEQLDTSLTLTRSLLGSPIYMSPEQVRNARTVDHRSDIWSLGVCLFELLTDHVPFNGHTVTAVAAAIASDPIPDIRSIRAEVPSELCVAIGRCLAKDPDARYQSIIELAAALMPFAAIDLGQFTRFSLGNLDLSRTFDPARTIDSCSLPAADAQIGGPGRYTAGSPALALERIRHSNALGNTQPLRGSELGEGQGHVSPAIPRYRRNSPAIAPGSGSHTVGSATIPASFLQRSANGLSHWNGHWWFRWVPIAAVVIGVAGTWFAFSPILRMEQAKTLAPQRGGLSAGEVGSCLSTEKLCDGQCISRERADHGCDADACAACTTANATPRCNSHGKCDIALCHKGFEDCDGQRATGCEVDIRKDPDNCGACGKRCPPIANAERGCGDFCTIWRCNSGYRDCNEEIADGCEVRVERDNKNCGHCGVECVAGKQCREGSCR